MWKKCIFILLSISSIISIDKYHGQANRPNSKVVEIEKGLFELIQENSDERSLFRCTLGGQPLAIWSVPSNTEIDSLEFIKPSFLKEGFNATDFKAEKHIRSDIKEEDYYHIKTINPANGASIAAVWREDKPFYVATANFAPVYCNNSNQTYSTYEVVVGNEDDTEYTYTRATPLENYEHISSVGVFVYQTLKFIEVNHYAWDPFLPWPNYYLRKEQDLYYLFAPRTYDGNRFGHGFYICGEEEEPEDFSKKNQGNDFTTKDSDLIELVNSMKKKEKIENLEYLK